MNLGIFLSSGDSLTNMARSGQRSRFIEFYLKAYSKNFSKVYLFTYDNETADDLPQNVILVSNKYNFPRLVYGALLPFINYSYLKECDVLRIFHLLGTFPAIESALFFRKKYIFNFAYDYLKFTKIERKNFQLLLLSVISPLAEVTATKIIAANKRVLGKLPMNKTVYIPNGAIVEIFKPLKTKRRKKTIQILSIGRLETQKNYANLIKALRGLPVTLTLVGGGSLKHRLLSLADENKIELNILDKIDNRLLPKFYPDYDIFILPSLIEGSPKVLLEAMACGLAVIVSKVEGNEDIITDGVNGLFCSTESKSIRNAVKRLQGSQKLRKKLGEKARQTVMKEYNLVKIVESEIKILKGIK